MKGLIDTHFHLDMYRDYNGIYRYIDKEKQYTLCMTNSPGVFLSCKNMFRSSKYVKFALGFHPLNAELKEKDLKDFMYLLPQTDYVGEIGLDFTKKDGLSRNRQIYYFEKIVEVCSARNKLISVHIRDAEEEVLEVFRKYHPKRCILHWYTGNKVHQMEFVGLGCYFSVNANMLKNMGIIDGIPKNKLLIESDGPYSKVDGKKFTPQLLYKEYDLIARALHEPELVRLIYDNFRNILTI